MTSLPWLTRGKRAAAESDDMLCIILVLTDVFADLFSYKLVQKRKNKT